MVELYEVGNGDYERAIEVAIVGGILIFLLNILMELMVPGSCLMETLSMTGNSQALVSQSLTCMMPLMVRVVVQLTVAWLALYNLMVVRASSMLMPMLVWQTPTSTYVMAHSLVRSSMLSTPVKSINM